MVPAASVQALTQYFEQLLSPADVSPVDLDVVAPRVALAPPAPLARLALPFSDDDVRTVLSDLKPGRSADVFGLSSEVIEFLLPYVSSFLTPLFNRFFCDGFPPSLATSVLIPIYKGKGDPSEPSNFRGISILPIFSKLYACLLERRLSTALDACGLRADSQFGFRRRRGTREAAFVLRTLFDSRQQLSSARPLYCAFVDLQKAFDSVQRPLLWRLLLNRGVPAPFVCAIESYYSEVKFSVETPAGLGPVASARLGVKQGCPLSPVLFGVFIEALLEDFLDCQHGLDLPSFSPASGAPSVPPLLFADDIALTSNSPAGLQRQLQRLHALTSSYGLRINVDKTKLLPYGHSAPSISSLPQLDLDGQPLEWVQEFKYLGLLVHHRDGFRRAGAALQEAALAKYYAMIRQCKTHGVEDAHSLNVLFNSLVTSVLSYGAPVWAPDLFQPSLDASNRPQPLDAPSARVALEIEKLQRKFMRYQLGLPQRTPHLALHVEAQRPPVALQLYKTSMRFLEHLRSDVFDDNSLVSHALACSAHYSFTSSWLRSLQSWSASLGSPFSLDSCISPSLSELYFFRPPSFRASRSQAALLGAPPSSSFSFPRALGVWVTRDLLPRARSDPSFSPHPISSSPRLWPNRPPAFYSQFPSLSSRSLVAKSRLRLPFSTTVYPFKPSLASLPDLVPPHLLSSFRSELVSLSSPFSFNPLLPLDLLLSPPPVGWPSFVRSLLSLLRRFSPDSLRPP